MPSHKINLTDDFDRIQNVALNKKRTDLIHSWAAKTIEKSYIRISDKYKDCDFELNWNKTK